MVISMKTGSLRHVEWIRHIDRRWVRDVFTIEFLFLRRRVAVFGLYGHHDPQPSEGGTIFSTCIFQCLPEFG